jgi:hypothetical protein
MVAGKKSRRSSAAAADGGRKKSPISNKRINKADINLSHLSLVNAEQNERSNTETYGI